MQDHRWTRSHSALALTFSLASIAPLSAQQDAVGRSQDAAAIFEEIIVTAQKREQPVHDVPIAISALNDVMLNNAGAWDIGDVSRLVPSLDVQTATTPVSTSFRLRRLGSLGTIPTFEPAVGVFIDGAYRTRAVYGAGDLFDVDRIEVLRGPQSTLYGKNVSAGVVGHYTRAPADELTVHGELVTGMIEAGRDATLLRFKAGVAGPVSGAVRGSLGMAHSSHDETMTQALLGGGENANDLDRTAVRGQLHWDATDRFDVRLIVAAATQDDKTHTADVYYDPEGFVPLVLGAWQEAGVSTPCLDNNPRNRVGCSRKANTTQFDAHEATLLLNYELGNAWSLASMGSWDWFEAKLEQDDAAQLSAPVLRYHDTQESESFQQELRLASPVDRSVHGLAGVFHYQNQFRRGDGGRRPMFLADTFSAHPAVLAINEALLGAPLPIAAPGQIGWNDNRQESDYLGVFGHGTWKLGDRFLVNAGVRWQEETKEARIEQFVNDPSPGILSLALAPADVGGDLKRRTDKVTWSLTPQYFVTDDVMVFLTVATGFKSGGFDIGFGLTPMNSREFKDEDVRHYEGGFSSTHMAGRMHLRGSVFQTEIRDYQDAAYIGAQFSVGNAEKVDLKGFEFDGAFVLGGGFTTSVAVSYADLRYERNTSGLCYPGRAPDSPTNLFACDLSGERPVLAPKWKTHTALQYARGFAGGEFYARGDWSWTDDYNTSFSADPRLFQSAYSWVNLRAGLKWTRFEIALWVVNVLNETVLDISPVQNLYVGDGSYQAIPLEARSYGVTVRARY